MNEGKNTVYQQRIKSRRLLLILFVIIVLLLTVLVACQTDEPLEPDGETASEMVVSSEATASSGTAEAVLDPAPTPTDIEEPTPEDEPTDEAAIASETETPEEEPTATSKPAVTAAPSPTAEPTETSRTFALDEAPDGALISVLMDGQVGVLLDEIPEPYRDAAAQALLDRPQDFWEDLARRQVRLTRRRLNFRNFVYDNKGQLPMPPQELWSFDFDPAGPQRLTVGDGALEHELVAITYTYSSTLLSDADSVADTEPALAEIGGRWDEPFVLPLDPDLLLQRTGNACLNEAGFPPNSYDSENAFVFFDYTCQADSAGILGCHRSQLPGQSCREALSSQVGSIETEVEFERLAWDPDLADAVRVGDVTHTDSPDLDVVDDDLAVNRIVYRYFQADSCALTEQCVGDSGWRRLLQFNGTVHNVGAVDLDIGAVNVSNPLNNLFEYNSCHNHFHFSDYGDFYFAGGEQNISSKQAFCVESTDRISNNEWSPLTHSFTCRVQGVQAGWVDEYHAGLDCQWIDITDIEVPDEGISVTLGFTSNPDQFLCEGTPVFDEQGNPIWEPSGLKTDDGQDVNRPVCDFATDWDVNNDDSEELFLLPSGGLMTESCAGGEIGPLRNCGFSRQINGLTAPEGDGQTGTREPDIELPDGAFACQPGRQVQLSCSVEDDAAPQALRFCEYSHVLGGGTACLYQDALANGVAGGDEQAFSFSCPAARSETEPGGAYTFYTAPLFGEGDSQQVSCTVVE